MRTPLEHRRRGGRAAGEPQLFRPSLARRLNLPLSYWVNGTLIAGIGIALLGYGLGSLEATGLSLSTLSVLVILYPWLFRGRLGLGDGRHLAVGGRHAERGRNIVWTGAARIMVAIAVLGATGHLDGYFLQMREYAQLAWGKESRGPRRRSRSTRAARP